MCKTKITNVPTRIRQGRKCRQKRERRQKHKWKQKKKNEIDLRKQIDFYFDVHFDLHLKKNTRFFLSITLFPPLPLSLSFALILNPIDVIGSTNSSAFLVFSLFYFCLTRFVCQLTSLFRSSFSLSFFSFCFWVNCSYSNE